MSSEGKPDTDKDTGVVDRRDRKFAVSTNRGGASHRVRYVEAGGAGMDIVSQSWIFPTRLRSASSERH